MFGVYGSRLMRRHFHRLLLSGEDRVHHLAPGVPTIFFANHSSWWDAMLPFYLSVARWKMDTYAMMDEEQLAKYPFFRWLGTFSVNRSHGRDAMRTIEYASSLLRGTDRALWIYPQGELLPNDTRPLAFFSGVEHIARRVGTINLVPVAFRYEFSHEQRADIYVRIGEPVYLTGADTIAQHSLTDMLREQLTAELDALRAAIIEGRTGEYLPAMHGRRSMSARLERNGTR